MRRSSTRSSSPCSPRSRGSRARTRPTIGWSRSPRRCRGFAEAFRSIRTSLVFQQSLSDTASSASGNGASNGHGPSNGDSARPKGDAGAADPFVVMVTSAAPREGKSTTSANLAVAFAEGGASVLVVNCDFRRPTIHRRFGVFDEPRRVQDTLVPGVKIVTNVLSDPAANPSQVVAAQRQVIAAARGRFDVIILDTAPMLTANDAVGIVSAVDLVLLVAQLDMSSSDDARRVIELLARVDAPLSRRRAHRRNRRIERLLLLLPT